MNPNAVTLSNFFKAMRDGLESLKKGVEKLKKKEQTDKLINEVKWIAEVNAKIINNYLARLYSDHEYGFDMAGVIFRYLYIEAAAKESSYLLEKGYNSYSDSIYPEK
ncbi:hypothetical protein [Mycoplasma phocimorsus]|nr:hypothetical protein [Mycoplasma phocimorsus]